MPSENAPNDPVLNSANDDLAEQIHKPVGQTDNSSQLSIASASVFSQPVFAGHLHPLTIVLGLWKASRAAIPIIPLILFGNRWFGWMVLMMTFVGAMATALTRYFSFGYRIEGHELITEEGIIGRKQRNIPLERIQEIRIEQGVLHRLLDVVDAQIETGSGGGAEARLSVLSRAEAERLRQTVFERVAEIRAGKQLAPDRMKTGEEKFTEPEEIVIRRLSVKELVLAGLTTNHLLSALVLAGAIWNFAEDILPNNFYRRAVDAVFLSSQQLLMKGFAATLVLTLLFIIVVLVIGIIFSVAGSVALFYGFTFSLRGEDLHRRYGLLTRRASSLPRRRIQTLKIEEKAIRRLFGLATLRADTSGSKREDKDDNDGRDVLLPIVPRYEVDQLLNVFFPDFAGDRTEWQRVSRLAIRRGTIKGGLVCAAVAVASLAFGRISVAILALAFLPLVYLINVKRYQMLGYSVGEIYLRTRAGWLGRSTHIVPINKIQAAEIHQTPFDRRLGLATLTIDTAGQAYTGGGPQIGNLPINEAREIAHRLARQASLTAYKW